MNDESEEWRPVDGWPYAVSSLGRFRRTLPGKGTHAGRILKPWVGAYGRQGTYFRAGVRLCRDGRERSVFLHTLVCAAFHGQKPSIEHQVAHWDGNALNNRADNLRWATAKENIADKKRHGTQLRGDRHPNRKLNETQVREIHELLQQGGRTRKTIGLLYGVCSTTIRKIASGKMWAAIPLVSDAASN